MDNILNKRLVELIDSETLLESEKIIALKYPVSWIKIRVWRIAQALAVKTGICDKLI